MTSAPKSTGSADSPRAAIPAPVTGSARLVLFVTLEGEPPNTTPYSLLYLDPHPSIGQPAWRLTKADGSHYDVILRPHGGECSCADWLYRRNHKDPQGCKHLRGLRAVGLLRKE